jgi:cbb3-type cytochrome oxidase subunit 3
MFASFFDGSDLLLFPLLAMFVFLTTFLAVLGWVFVGARKRRLDRLSSLPLHEDAGSVPARRAGK